MKRIVATLGAMTLWAGAAVAQAPMGQSGTSQQPMGDKSSMQEVESIRSHTQQYQEAWNKKDLKSLMTHYADQATVIDAMGNRAMGKQQIQSWLSENLQGMYKDARTQLTVTNVRLLAPTIAVVDLDQTISGIRLKDGSTLPPQQFHATVVGMKRGNKWMVHDMRLFQFISPEQLGVGGAGQQEPLEPPSPQPIEPGQREPMDQEPTDMPR